MKLKTLWMVVVIGCDLALAIKKVKGMITFMYEAILYGLLRHDHEYELR